MTVSGIAGRLRARGRAPGGWALALPVLLLLAPFLLWPLGTVLWRSFAPEGDLSGTAFADVLGDRFYWERLVFTTAQAVASTALALAIGLPAAYVFAHLRFPGRALARALVTVPFVLPTLVVALAFQQLVGPEGWLNDLLGLGGLGPIDALGTIWLILFAHVFYNVSIVIRLVSGVWANLDPRAEEAARLLGAGRLATLRGGHAARARSRHRLRGRARLRLQLHLVRGRPRARRARPRHARGGDLPARDPARRSARRRRAIARPDRDDRRCAQRLCDRAAPQRAPARSAQRAGASVGRDGAGRTRARARRRARAPRC